MGALGIMMRRAGMIPFPATEEKPEIDESITLYSGIKSDGASYVVVPNFTLKRDDTFILNYSGANIDTMQLAFGARAANKGVFFGIQTNKVAYFGEFATAGTQIPAQTSIAGFNQPNTTFKTSVGYSEYAGGVRRLFFVNDMGQLSTLPGNTDETLTNDLYVLTSNTAGTQDADTRYFQGVIHSLKVLSYAGEEKLSLLPATKNGVAGMYDEVSRSFFGNSGVGTLTVI